MRPTFEEVKQAIEDDDYAGFCVSCGEVAYGVEPDACRYECEACESPMVYGAEEILIRGLYR